MVAPPARTDLSKSIRVDLEGSPRPEGPPSSGQQFSQNVVFSQPRKWPELRNVCRISRGWLDIVMGSIIGFISACMLQLMLSY